MMGAELKAAGLSRIVVPYVAKRDYISTLRQLTVRGACDPIVRCLLHCQEVTAVVSEPDIGRCIETWATTHAFLAPETDLTLILPTSDPVERRNGVPAPASFWEAQGQDRSYP